MRAAGRRSTGASLQARCDSYPQLPALALASSESLIAITPQSSSVAATPEAQTAVPQLNSAVPLASWQGGHSKRRIQGVVHDPQHRPIVNALVKLQAATSQWSAHTESNTNGEFFFLAVPVGEYRIVVAERGFESERQTVVVDSRSAPVVHFQLALATLSQTTVVESEALLPSLLRAQEEGTNLSLGLLNSADLVVVGTLHDVWTYPWADGWHQGGTI